MNATNLRRILLVGSMSILAACGGVTLSKPPTAGKCEVEAKQVPPKPTLLAIGQANGMVCFSPDDTVKLGKYIMDLEAIVRPE